MGKAVGCLVVLGVVVLGLALSVAGVYNSLVGLSQAVDAQWAQVENVYQRRADLVPQLVATVQGAADFERGTILAVTEARAAATQVKATPELVNDPAAFARWQAAQDQLSSALSRLLVVVEKYPDLKATQNFRDLQAQLEGTENRIAVERMRFNEKAQEYNTRRLQFPAVLIANLAGFREKAYFKSAAGAEQAPKVEFRFGPSPAAPAPSPAS